MSVSTFDPRGEIPIVEGDVWGPHGRQATLRLVLDSGSALTIISPGILDDLGYGARDGERITRVQSAVGVERGYTIRVKKFRALGFAFPEFLINAFDLPEYGDIDGLLGWDFLQRFNFEVRPREGSIVALPCPP